MGRGGSRGGSSRGRSSSPAPPPRQAPSVTKPMPAQTPIQAPTQSSGGMFSGFGSMIAQGMAFGAGSEVAHQAVRAVIGGGSSHSHEQAPQQQAQNTQQYQNPCQFEADNFSKCLSTNDNIQFCQNFSEMLKNCRQANNIL